MEEDIVDTPDNETGASPQIKPRLRRKWLLPTLLIVVLLFGVAAWMVHFTARRTIVGKTAPATGYRCTFTVGQGWQPDKLDDWIKVNSLEIFRFKPPKPAPFQVWLQKYLLHRTPPATSSYLPSEVLVCSFGEPQPSWIKMELQDGYPTLIRPKPLPIYISMLEQKHMLVSGHRATRISYKLNGLSMGVASIGNTSQSFYGYAYLVKVTDRPLWYAILGKADEEYHTQVANEMQQICDSFRIEKVSGK